jgi:alkanesulfonate monooxygenase SsuD/methylene tetrahydromethanopterin reductase-like flavin-dependent oxidoreductase (luciferase family)
MRYGFVLPSGNARTAADFAREAEEADWEGFFVWEPIWGNDAWVSLTAAAMATSTIRLGTMLTPLSRMRPWKLASETASVDNLSGGRVILAVGLGAVDTGFEAFGEVTDRRERAELLDEGLDILTGLWKGQPFSYSGKHYTVSETSFQPPEPPVQRPRIPIWVVGAWPRPKSMRRALRYDGILPNVMDESGEHRQPTPEDIAAIAQYVRDHRSDSTAFEIIQEGQTPGGDRAKAAAIIRPWAEAGATWWLEAMWDQPFDDTGRAAVLQRLKQGPPRI